MYTQDEAAVAERRLELHELMDMEQIDVLPEMGFPGQVLIDSHSCQSTDDDFWSSDESNSDDSSSDDAEGCHWGGSDSSNDSDGCRALNDEDRAHRFWGMSDSDSESEGCTFDELERAESNDDGCLAAAAAAPLAKEEEEEESEEDEEEMSFGLFDEGPG